MSENPHELWDPRSPEVLANQIAAYDEMRGRCPIAHSDFLGWSVFRHAEVLRILNDQRSFSNAVSVHLNVPNGMDPPEHTRYRAIIDRYFEPVFIDGFAPTCRDIARELVAGLPSGELVRMMSEFAEVFALRVQCAFMGWPDSLHEPLRQWTKRNRDATLAQDREAMDAIALQFDGYISAMLAERRKAGDRAPDDLTSALLRERIEGRLLSNEEIVSIVRNWTVGELGTIAASVGIVAHFLATHPQIQERLRAERSLLPAAIDEILRIHAPLISNRRICTRDVEIGGQRLAAGERLTVLWASANRDEAVFGDPDVFRLDRDPRDNLLYGAGAHVCPGAPLARLELRVLFEELLDGTTRLEPVPGLDAVRAIYPGSGFEKLPLLVF